MSFLTSMIPLGGRFSGIGRGQESVPFLLGFGDDRNEPGVLDLGQVVLEGWKAAQ